MKKFYIAVTIEENEKLYSYAIPITENDNLISKLAAHKNIIHANIYNTKKQAEYVINHWNACHKINGIYLFDDAPAF